MAGTPRDEGGNAFPLPTELHDFKTHRAAWRKALQINFVFATGDDESYWSHELRVYDEAMVAFDAHHLPRPMSSAPKTDVATMIAQPFLGWCPDATAPNGNGGDWRVCWWEPRLKGGSWGGDRDLPEHPVVWLPLPAPGKVGA